MTEDAGEYQCEVSNTLFEDQSPSPADHNE